MYIDIRYIRRKQQSCWNAVSFAMFSSYYTIEDCNSVSLLDLIWNRILVFCSFIVLNGTMVFIKCTYIWSIQKGTSRRTFDIDFWIIPHILWVENYNSWIQRLRRFQCNVWVLDFGAYTSQFWTKFIAYWERMRIVQFCGSVLSRAWMQIAGTRISKLSCNWIGCRNIGVCWVWSMKQCSVDREEAFVFGDLDVTSTVELCPLRKSQFRNSSASSVEEWVTWKNMATDPHNILRKRPLLNHIQSQRR